MRTVPPAQAAGAAQALPRAGRGLRRAQTVAAAPARLHLDLGRVTGREQYANAGVGRRGVDLLGLEQGVVELVAPRPRRVVGDAVGDRDGQVKDGVVVRPIESVVLADGYLGFSVMC